MSVSKDEEVHLHAVHTDTSILYNLKTQVPRTGVTQCGFNIGDSQLILSPERIAMYGDSEWRHSMFQAIRNVVRSLSFSHMHACTCAHIYSLFLILILFVNIFYFF
jgi:hypothetical protein